MRTTSLHLCLALSAGLAAPMTLAQDVGAYTGRDFGGLQLNLPAQQGGLTLAARSASIWTQEPSIVQTPTVPGEAPSTLGSEVRRLALAGDVRISIGSRRLTASRAVVWVENVTDRTGAPLMQVAIYVDRMLNPTAGTDTGGGVSSVAQADRLLITAHVQGEMILASDAPPLPVAPASGPMAELVREGELRLARFLQRLEDPTFDDGGSPPVPATPDQNLKSSRYHPSLDRPYVPGSPYGPDGPPSPVRRVRQAPGLDAPLGADQRLFSASRGTLTVAAGQPVLIAGDDENRVVITGGVVLQYSEPARDRGLQLAAQNAVVFLKPGPLEDLFRNPAANILGVYLEGDVVATDNRFTLRAAHVYYDFVANQAYTVDAVFSTYDSRRELPLYVRAQTVRQTTRNSVTATGVTISASAFYDPVLSLGASSVTLTRETSASGRDRVLVDGSSFTPRLGGLPFFYIPSYSGDIERFPLKDIRAENSSESGFGLQTRWDVFGLTGLEPPVDDDLDIDLLLDGWFKRGIGAGLDVRWTRPEDIGSILAYGLPSDDGTDVLTSGERIDRDGDGRGLLLYEQRISFDSGWQVLAEASSVSDRTFIDAYFEDMAESRREFASGVELRYAGQNAAFSLRGRDYIDDFVSNEYLLQSQGFSVRRLPELTYTRVADDLLPEISPGLLTWTHEYRIGMVGLDMYDTAPNQIGFSTVPLADRAFGLAPGTTFEQSLLAAGFSDDNVMRADTRHRIDWNIDAGPVRLQPFVIGRATWYDDEFAAIAPPDQQDQLRWWAGGGATASTQLQRLYEGFSSQAFDAQQLRHIVEPSLTLFSAGTNRRNEFLPQYDTSVEGAQEGTAWRFGIAQTFQTLRGRAAPDAGSSRAAAGGRVVDLVRWNIDFVDATSDTDKAGVLGKWFEYRPEESLFGNYANTDVQVQLTDATTLVGGTTYDFDIDQPSRTSVGVITDHGRDFKVFGELRFLNALDATLVTLGADYRLSSLYTLGATGSVDSDDGDLQELTVRVNREFPELTLTVRVRYNNITDETTAGVLLTPLARARRSEYMRRLGRDAYLAPLLPTLGPSDAAP